MKPLALLGRIQVNSRGRRGLWALCRGLEGLGVFEYGRAGLVLGVGGFGDGWGVT